ncbi:D-lactate dehydrogenase NDAI_0A01830 [Naumovozyma dairenensis CBS 421]|uniref:D-lactate dehydrogenase (cytochrome) n=1 Tax=Naumovozyma dairenensis (strain ATCC 10597 / BCRC 20456 / CBS 421 / NBRC 0211 / NRRL Y-12639) TaxID=1071378 RepID=G0W3F3_NAUDC|nr:hypothetical protein NDAI_0A01830 [Naumovozyma dairenensis CBS 421]CCD22341.1 hypothetical protein NDAI_0A01830 [Naumovozyma dairenensis CBS 421]
MLGTPILRRNGYVLKKNLKCFSRSSTCRNLIYRNSSLQLLKNKRFYSTEQQRGVDNNDGSSTSSSWLSYFFTTTISATAGYLLATTFMIDNEKKLNKLEKSIIKNVEVTAKSTLPLTDLESPNYTHDEATEEMIMSKLKEILGNNPENYSIHPSELNAHSDTQFNTHHPNPNIRPKIILFPHSTEEISQILAFCNEYKVPIIPFSGGTSLEGHFLPTRANCLVTIDISKYMNNIIKLNQKDLDITVQGGVGWEDLNDYLADYGLMFGCDPGPGATISGAVANSCSGTNAQRYGTMKENVINMTVVLPDGTIVKTKGRPRKSSAGYNLNGLFTGSEGTLGIITEVTIKCHVISKFETVAVVSFPSIQDAASCASNVIQQGIQLNALELLDDNMMKLINKSGATTRSDWIEKPTMFFKIGGITQNIVNELVNELEKIAHENKCENFQFAKSDEEKVELWEARKVALWSVLDAGRTTDLHARVWTTDVAVPFSKFPEVIEKTKEELDESGLINAIAGHSGDGNFHSFIIYRNDEERAKCTKIVSNMVKRAIEAEGTCTGEHGVGIGKRDFVLQELGTEPVDLMRKIKLTIDPNRIMNPDKVFKTDPNEPEDDYI